ncbi:MAG TPA: restriction endonuclease subunit S [Syntrophorhabdus sp.]|nr:restriction endonuclease subunit S [Syntrophorhabdus sp.]
MQLHNVCELIVDCEHKTAPTQETGHPSIRTPNIGRGYFILDGVNRVSEDTYKLWTRRAVPRPGDLIMAREAPVGNVAMIPVGLSPCLGQRTLLIRPNRSSVEPAFLNYFLNGPYVQQLIHAKTNGVTVPHLNMEDVRTMELPELPPLPVQRRIAGILSAYDDLIENCQKRIKILETMARALYREWFVHFRFPGHENVPLVPSPLGEIPHVWKVKRVPECVDISPRVAVPRDGVKPFVPMGCLSNDSMLITDIESRAGNSGAKFQNGDTLFARITPCLENGKTGFVQFLPDAQTVGFGSTEFIVLRSRTLTPEFVYLLARSEEFRGVAIKSMSGATGRQRVQEQCFDDFRIAQPPRALLDLFSDIVAPSFRLIYKLHLQIQNLRQTRDLLLPRLLSGQTNLKKDIT